MHHITITPATIAVAAGVAIGARLLSAYRVTRRTPQEPTAQQLTDAHRAGYALALTHVSRGLLTAAPEEP
ncbi:hypothetical protein KME66_20520 [Streptomyces sp. YPW6]|uniref:hypothetical protein n=1 Tax=Streptomyces sp. YPW6 TaxID=2840373 RepID=UPI001C0E597F|nr:hypothetical protein [Streptomyces sp. YPW6]QWQ43098.1 hypothetical protein KME66_20520 [Streptomyces sp. YPW6]